MKENKISKVLKEVFYGTKLYSTAIGEVKFNGMLTLPDNSKRIKLTLENNVKAFYFPDGRYRKEGEITLYPSKRMRDWDKFAWKKGDVLVNSCGTYCIFEEFSGYPYTIFLAKFTNYIDIISNSIMVKDTKEWNKVPSETAKKYIERINTSLKKENRRLNLETLEVEDIKPKPKKENATYKKVSDKLEHEFQPFEKVLVRDDKDGRWTPAIFGYKNTGNSEFKYIVCGGFCWKYCVPYKGNEHLLGTTNSQEE